MPGRKQWDTDRMKAMVKATRNKEQARIFSFPQTTLEQYVKNSEKSRRSCEYKGHGRIQILVGLKLIQFLGSSLRKRIHN